MGRRVARWPGEDVCGGGGKRNARGRWRGCAAGRTSRAIIPCRTVGRHLRGGSRTRRPRRAGRAHRSCLPRVLARVTRRWLGRAHEATRQGDVGGVQGSVVRLGAGVPPWACQAERVSRRGRSAQVTGRRGQRRGATDERFRGDAPAREGTCIINPSLSSLHEKPGSGAPAAAAGNRSPGAHTRAGKTYRPGEQGIGQLPWETSHHAPAQQGTPAAAPGGQ